MRKLLLAALVSVLTLALAPTLAQSAAAAAPTHTLSATGTGVVMYPAFASSIHRYGITTSAATAGTVTVTATTSDATGTVWVDGQRAAGGTKTLTGLTTNSEISVFIKDSAGTAVYSLIYLPAKFPVLTVATKKPGIAVGDVFLTLGDFTGTTPSYETAVDNNGVPIFVHVDTGVANGTDQSVPTDFKLQPNGHYSVFRQPTAAANHQGGEVVELNSKFQKIAAYVMSASGSPAVTYTDGHDSILEPNGDRWLLGLVQHTDGSIDSVIQEQSPNGTILFQWDTADHVTSADSLDLGGDFTHLNSIALMPNGDILASLRNMSQVMEIATSNRGTIHTGDIVWSLGGRHPTLALHNPVGDAGDAGPCAQHDATVLKNGDILIFDDGSAGNGTAPNPRLCVNPADPTGPGVNRVNARVTEYSINAADTQATLVWSYPPVGVNSGIVPGFGGSAQRFNNGNTLIGWGGSHAALATEVNNAATPQVLWQLTDSAGMISYRALRYAAPDATAPVVSVTQPAQGATYTFGQAVNSNFSCTDKGGSSLQSCSGPVAEGGRIPTSTPGSHTFAVTATDGAGHTTTVTRTYQVGPSPMKYQPDAMIKRPASVTFVGRNVFSTAAKQHITETVTKAGKFAEAQVRFQNDGNATDRITIHGSAATSKFKVTYFAGTRNVSRQVIAGTYKTASLATGRTFTLLVKVTRTAKAKPGNSRTVTVSARSVHGPTKHDAVETIVRAKR